MVRVAIIEDEPAFRQALAGAAAACGPPGSLRADCFGSAEAFLAAAGPQCGYTGLFIDIELGGMDGLSLARLLRGQGYRGVLVFITNHEQFVYDGYEVQAFRYLRKPVGQAALQGCIDHMRRQEEQGCLTFTYQHSQYCIPWREIYYLSSRGHYLTAHTAGGGYEWKCLLKELQPRLPGQFIRCHRSFVINLDHLRRLESRRALLSNGEEVDVAAGYLPGLRRALSRMI